MSRSRNGDYGGCSGYEASFEAYHDQSRPSFQASRGNASSFSVYEDNDESSFAPYHDSWVQKPKQPPQVQAREVDSMPRYRMPLGVPLNAHEEDVHPGENTMAEHTFTQFDIRHPSQFEPVSTPRGRERPGGKFKPHHYYPPLSLRKRLSYDICEIYFFVELNSLDLACVLGRFWSVYNIATF